MLTSYLVHSYENLIEETGFLIFIVKNLRERRIIRSFIQQKTI